MSPITSFFNSTFERSMNSIFHGKGSSVLKFSKHMKACKGVKSAMKEIDASDGLKVENLNREVPATDKLKQEIEYLREQVALQKKGN